MKTHHTFSDVRNAIFSPPKRARGGRAGLVASGNPDVLREAEGKEDYAKGDEGGIRARTNNKQRKRGGKTLGQMTGSSVRHRADRAPRKRASGGASGPYVQPWTNTLGYRFPVGGVRSVPLNLPTQSNNPAQAAALMGAIGKSGVGNSNVAPIGNRGLAPIAIRTFPSIGGLQNLSGGSKRGGRVREKHKRKTR